MSKEIKFNYQTICNNLLKELPSRSQDILEKRLGLNLEARGEEKMTLEAIGKEYNLTRERVRQIEEDSLDRIKEVAKINCEALFRFFEEKIRIFGSLKKEDNLVSELSSQNWDKNQILFLLTLNPQFQRFKETEDFYSFWTVDLNSITLAKKVINNFIETLNQKNKPMTLEQYIKSKSPISKFGLSSSKVLFSYLEVSKRILRNSQGLYGFSDWPEINPKRVKDKAYLALKKEQKPLHFAEIAELVGKISQGEEFSESGKPSLPKVQTVHNELIRDTKFVLVGRGVYALSEWGYQPGQVRDIIFNTLKEVKKPLSKSEILKKVLKQRLVKENTILLNLNNKKYFLRDSQGRYRARLV